jgi:short subunit dehydrogenase-like uncharacterized protein
MSGSDWILYGATGYTGRLIADEAVRRGLQPILAGRNRQTVEELAHRLSLRYRIFRLADVSVLRQSIRGAKLVLNCAGPFSATARPLMLACLSERVHYLDITGEIDVIEAAAALNQDAKSAGVTLLPAVGFDVVPSDCLAAELAQKLPGAERLLLAISGMASMSPGTAKTVLESSAHGGRVRLNGRIVHVPVAWTIREVPFQDGTRMTMTIPWGDVASAYYSTGIPNIEVYAAVSPRQIRSIRRWRSVLPILGIPPIKTLAKRYVERKVIGPSTDSRENEAASLWGRVEDHQGQSVEATLTTPNGYSLTVTTALAVVERILQSPVATGFQTPALAFGPDFITGFPGCDLRFTAADRHPADH